jgi:tripartite-type tricarboxylate transporter receptor subunit TctC
VALAQSFPDKTITVVVPNPPGGVVDSSARLVADPLTKLFGQAVIIDNRAGASGNIAYQMVARAEGRLHAAASYSAYHVGNPAMFPAAGPEGPGAGGADRRATNVITAHPRCRRRTSRSSSPT